MFLFSTQFPHIFFLKDSEAENIQMHVVNTPHIRYSTPNKLFQLIRQNCIYKLTNEKCFSQQWRTTDKGKIVLFLFHFTSPIVSFLHVQHGPHISEEYIFLNSCPRVTLLHISLSYYNVTLHSTQINIIPIKPHESFKGKPQDIPINRTQMVIVFNKIY